MTELAPGTRMAGWLEQAWMERYLARQLGEAESAWFEGYMLDKAELLDQLDADSDLRDAVHSAVATGAYGASADADPQSRADQNANGDRHSTRVAAASVSSRSATTPVSLRNPDSDRHARRPASARGSWFRSGAMGAGFALALAVGWLGRSQLGARSGDDGLIASPTRIVFDSARGSAAVQHVERRDSDSRLVLVEVGLPPGAKNVTLELPDAPEVGLTISPDGFASFLLDRNRAALNASATLRYQLHGRTERVNVNTAEALKESEK